MKSIYLVILLSSINVIGFAQVQSTCEIPEELEYYYRFDVADLALGRMYQTNSHDTASITIPPEQQDSVWHGLAAIFNAATIAERDSVFDIHCIHNYSYSTKYLLPYIHVKLDTTIAWTHHWLNGEITTGYEELDDFVSSYQYNFLSISPPYVVIYSEEIVNSYVVSDSLMKFDGINVAGPIHTTLDGDEIIYSVDGEYQTYQFSRGWGDCFSGCIYNHRWVFRVHYTDCTVEYMGLESNAQNNFPNPRNCNITYIEEHKHGIHLTSYPNPFTTSTTIEYELNEPSRVQLTIYNAIGEIVYKAEDRMMSFGKHNFLWNPERLPEGLYYAVLRSEEGVSVIKMIKQ